MSQSQPSPSVTERLRRFDPTVLPIAVAVLVLAGAVIWLLGRPAPGPAADARIASDVAALRERQAQLEQLSGRVSALEGMAARIGALENRPAPAIPDLAPLREALAAATGRLEAAEQRADGLEERITATARELASRPAVDPASFAPRAAVEQAGARLDALAREQQAAATQAQQRVAGAEQAIAGFASRIAANESGLAARSQTIEQQAGRISQIEQQIQTRLAQLDAQSTQRGQAIEQQVQARLAQLDAQLAQRGQVIEQQAQRIAALEGASQRLSALEGRAARMAALDAVRTRLDAGQSLGLVLRTLADPPRELARFSDTAPPTEAQLRLSFEDAARAALIASEPARPGGSVLDSAVSRLSGLVTVRRGEEVLWGDAAAAEIERARRAVEAGDLDAALAALARLSPPARQAMSEWLGQAESLVAARRALRQMAAG